MAIVRGQTSVKVRKVQFVVQDLDAEEICVTGDFTDWSPEGIPLRRNDNGQFRTELVLAPGEYQYRLRVDGDWADHRDAPRTVPNPYGTSNGVLTVS